MMSLHLSKIARIIFGHTIALSLALLTILFLSQMRIWRNVLHGNLFCSNFAALRLRGSGDAFEIVPAT